MLSRRNLPHQPLPERLLLGGIVAMLGTDQPEGAAAADMSERLDQPPGCELERPEARRQHRHPLPADRRHPLDDLRIDVERIAREILRDADPYLAEPGTPPDVVRIEPEYFEQLCRLVEGSHPFDVSGAAHRRELG